MSRRRSRAVGTVLAISTSILLATGLTVLAAPPATAATGCVWTKAEVRGGGYQRDAGRKECASWSSVKRIGGSTSPLTPCANGYRVVLQTGYAYYCHMNAWTGITKELPIAGGPKGSKSRQLADYMRRLAADHGLVLQTATVDLNGRPGCPSTSPTYISGTYSPSGANGRPGRGLIRVGLSDSPESCLRYWGQAKNIATHEIAHGLIDRLCGTISPPIVGDRMEPVTGAYAAMFLGNTDTGGQTAGDRDKAAQIRDGRCE